MEKQTYDVTEFGQLLGIGRSLAYTEAHKGSIAGIPVIKVGIRMLVSKALADRVLQGETQVNYGPVSDRVVSYRKLDRVGY